MGASLIYLLVAVALSAALMIPMFAAMGFDVLAMVNGAQSSPPTPPDSTKLLWILPLGFLAAFVLCVLAASFEAACLRWMIRGERPGLFGMTLDEDTWRVYGIYWVWLFFFLVAWIGFLILAALLGRLFPDNQVALAIGGALYACAIGICAASLAPAAAVSIAEKRFAFFDAFQASEDHFGSLLGSYAVLVGAQWLTNYGFTAAWLFWALRADVAEHFANVTDYMTFNNAYAQAVAAGMSKPGAAPVYWAITAGSYLLSFVISVLIYGVNARVARLALQEGRISATPASA